MNKFLSALLPVIFLFILWQSVIVIFDLPHYILPKPKDVFFQLINQYSLLWEHTQTTLLEIVIGIILGCFFGLGCFRFKVAIEKHCPFIIFYNIK